MKTMRLNPEKGYFKSIENQRSFMDSLFHQFRLSKLEDWHQISRRKIIDNGGYTLVLYSYSNDKKKLLTSIYPNFPWKFETSQQLIKKNSYFKSIENQREFMCSLYEKFELTSMEDWLKISKNKIISNGGRALVLLCYSNDIKQLLSAVFPHYPWHFDIKLNEKLNENKKFQRKESHIRFMDQLYYKLDLKSLEDWLNITKRTLYDNGARNLLLYHYANDKTKLLTTIYPNYAWNFQSDLQIILNKKKDFRTIENQRKFMDNLFIKFKLKSLDDWVEISRNKLMENGGKSLLLYYYSNDMKKLLTSIYPNHQWNFDNQKIKFAENENFFITLENQQKYLDYLSQKFKLKSLDDWLFISERKICKYKGGKKLLSIYSNNVKKMISSIYPNHFFRIEKLIKIKKIQSNELKKLKKNKITAKENFISIENQQKFMDKLFIKFQLKSLEDFIHISRNKIILNKGKTLLLLFYSNDKKKLLQTIYPNYPWQFLIDRKNDRLIKLSFIEKQRKIMEKTFKKYQLKSLDDWLQIKRIILYKSGVKKLLLSYYADDMKNLLLSIYPNYPWQFDKMKIKSADYFKSFSNQKKFMDNLFVKFQLKTISDWLSITKTKLSTNGGSNLISIYSNQMDQLLPAIYPNYPWESHRFELNNLNNQQHLMEELFIKFKLEKISDWLNISKNQIMKNGGRKLLEIYNLDLLSLLISIYPNYSWQFDKLKYRRNISYFSSIQFYKRKIKFLIDKFIIEKKQDWYRLPLRFEDIDLFRILNLIFPNEKWKKSVLSFRSKKTTQRYLYIALREIFHSLITFEDYRHPLIQSNTHDIPLEFDVFIPSLNLAFEYQGMQHYFDIPAGFSTHESYLSRDKTKESLSNQMMIKLIYVPFWWDLSISSLFSTIVDKTLFVK